jgi:hypothetical protein
MGHDDYLIPDTDILWRKRPQNWTRDMGAYEFMGPHSLWAHDILIYESEQSVIDLNLDAGIVNASRPYMIFGGVSWCAPGVQLPHGDKFLPINFDFFTDFVMQLLNTPVFENFSGTLDGQGKAIATIDTLDPMPPGTAPVWMHFAYACPYREPDGWFASNPLRIVITE